MDTPGARLRAAREKAGFKTAKEAALSLGVAIATYAEHENAQRFLPARRAALYAGAFRTEPEWLLYGRKLYTNSFTIPLLLSSGYPAGHEITGTGTVSTATRAVEITADDAVSPALVGWFAVFEETLLGLSPDLYCQLCVVAIPQEEDGDVALRVRRLVPAASPDRYHLAAEPLPTLFDTPLVWARRVTALVPG